MKQLITKQSNITSILSLRLTPFIIQAWFFWNNLPQGLKTKKS